MRIHMTRVVVLGLFFLITLISGLSLSRNLRQNDARLSGKPISGAAFTVHKFSAILTVISAVVTIRGLHKGMEFRSVELTAAVIAGLLFLVMFVTAAFLSMQGTSLSLRQATFDRILVVHKIGAFLTIISTFVAIYLLALGRG